MDASEVTEYLKSISAKAASPIELAYVILSARGFLLDLKDDEIYLSDNSSIGDFNSLNDYLINNGLGSIKENKYPAKIKFNSPMTIDLGKRLFMESPRVNFECVTYNRDWRYFKNRIHGHKVDVMQLEPFIARHVKAVSAIGIDTSMSCDGNHIKKNKNIFSEAYIQFHSRYDLIWYRLVMKNIHGLKSCGVSNYDNRRIIFTFSDETKLRTYLSLLEDANKLYENRVWLRGLKYRTTRIAHQKNTRLDDVSDENAYEILSECLNSIISQA